MLRVIRPVDITDAMLVSHSEPDSALPAYNPLTTYGAGTQVQYLHSEFESAQASNTGNTPDPAASTSWWVLIGPANRWAMLDGSVSTTTDSAGPVLEVAVQPQQFITAVGLANVSGAEVRVQSVSGGLTVFDETQAINGSTRPSPYEWCFGERTQVGDLIFSGIPPYLDAVLTVTITAGSSASCGVLTFGRIHELGSVETGAQAGVISYSRKETDQYGTARLLQRPNAKRMSLQVLLTRAELRFVNRLMASLDAVPCMWSGHEDVDTYGPLQMFGFLRDFRQVVEYYDHALMSADIEGLT